MILTAHPISTITLIILFAFFIGYIINRFPPSSSAQAILIGMIWVILTLRFEFGFGRYRSNSWLVYYFERKSLGLIALFTYNISDMNLFNASLNVELFNPAFYSHKLLRI